VHWRLRPELFPLHHLPPTLEMNSASICKLMPGCQVQVESILQMQKRSRNPWHPILFSLRRSYKFPVEKAKFSSKLSHIRETQMRVQVPLSSWRMRGRLEGQGSRPGSSPQRCETPVRLILLIRHSHLPGSVISTDLSCQDCCRDASR
jgi:hypothetical protein